VYKRWFYKCIVVEFFGLKQAIMMWNLTTCGNYKYLLKLRPLTLFVASQRHNLVIGFLFSGFTIALEVLFFMVNLKREFYKSNVSFESGSKNHLPSISTSLEMQQCCLIKAKCFTKVDSQFDCN